MSEYTRLLKTLAGHRVDDLTNTRRFLQCSQEYIEVFREQQRRLLIWLSEGCFIKIKAQYFGKDKVDPLANLSARF